MGWTARLRRLLKASRAEPCSPSLAAAIQGVADCPCERHRQSFLRAFWSADELCFAMGEASVDVVDREVTLSSEDIVAVPHSEVDGCTYMMACANRDVGKRLHPGTVRFVAMRIPEACQMLLKTDLDGIVVQAGTADLAWALLSREDAADMLGRGGPVVF
jgi:hypothetical protein